MDWMPQRATDRAVEHDAECVVLGLSSKAPNLMLGGHSRTHSCVLVLLVPFFVAGAEDVMSTTEAKYMLRIENGGVSHWSAVFVHWAWLAASAGHV